MLSIAEMTDARDQLKGARDTVAAVHLIYLQAGYVLGARLLNDVANLLSDECAALDKAIGAGQP